MLLPIKVKLIDSNLKTFLKKFQEKELTIQFDEDKKIAYLDDGYQKTKSSKIAHIQKNISKYLLITTIEKETGIAKNTFKFELLESADNNIPKKLLIA